MEACPYITYGLYILSSIVAPLSSLKCQFFIEGNSQLSYKIIHILYFADGNLMVLFKVFLYPIYLL